MEEKCTSVQTNHSSLENLVLRYLAHEFDKIFKRISNLKITRQIDLILRYLAHEWCDLTSLQFENNSSNWLGHTHLISVSMNLVLWHVTSPEMEVLVIPLLLQNRSYKSGTILTDWQRMNKMEIVTKVNPKLSSCCCCRFLEPLRLQTLRRTRLQNSVELPKDNKKRTITLVIDVM